MSVVQTSIEKGIAVITIDNPPVNAISQAVRAGLLAAVLEADQQTDVKAIIVTCAGRTFMAGADITEFGKPPVAPHLPDLINQIEAVSTPTIAAIHGTALGGGLEVALGCHYRVAVASAKVGLPEVQLGLLPGAGGTQRLPRVAGVQAALEMITSGKHVAAKSALEMGILDSLVEDDLLEGAIAFAEGLSAAGKGARPTSALTLDQRQYDQAFFDAFRQSIARRSRGYFAPEMCIQAVEAAVNLAFDQGLAKERELFAACMANPQSKAMQHVFFAQRQIARIPGIDKTTPRREIKKVGVIGAGTMGGGISMNFATAGIPVTILELSDEALERGLGVVRRNYEATAKKGRMTMEQVEACMANLNGTQNYDELSDCDLIIEAVFEKMSVKEAVFKELDRVAKPGAILASNTSYLDIDHIAAITSRPADVLGMHFFSPANVMKLLEIVRGKETADDVLATVVDLAKRIKKVGVVSGVCFGFIGNRMLSPYGREAGLMAVESGTPELIDKALYDFGMAMGPLTVFDLAGLDIGYMNRQGLGRDNYETLGADWMDRLVEADRKGLKVGAGVYDYDLGSRVPKPSAFTKEILADEAQKAGITQTPIAAEEAVERMMLALINEGAKILGEGIALRASDIDIVYLNGYGFPAYRGGPMHYADSLGIDTVAERINHYRTRFGDRWWTPAPLLEKLAAEGKSFADFDRGLNT